MSSVEPVVDLKLLLRDMDPQLHPGVYVFVAQRSPAPPDPVHSVGFSGGDSLKASHRPDGIAENARDDLILPAGVIAVFREAEGLSLVIEEKAALAAGFEILLRASWITLRVHSSLEAVGLTAAVSAALTDAGIPCNIVAAAFHDHLFVPVELAERSVAVLRQLQQSGN